MNQVPTELSQLRKITVCLSHELICVCICLSADVSSVNPPVRSTCETRLLTIAEAGGDPNDQSINQSQCQLQLRRGQSANCLLPQIVTSITLACVKVQPLPNYFGLFSHVFVYRRRHHHNPQLVAASSERYCMWSAD